MGLKQVEGTDICTHGGDELPEDVSVATARSAAPVLAASVPAPCPSDGVSGKRVRVMYGYPAGTQNRIDTQRDFIRDVVATADVNLDASTSATDGQHYRFFCSNDAAVTVTAVKLKKIGGDGKFTFGDLVTSLERQRQLGLGKKNYTDARFVFSVFVDNIGGGVYAPAGQGSMFLDDVANPDANYNNSTAGWTTRYSMMRLGFDLISEAGFFQHEVGHNLGAVQDSAEHSSGAGHCYEEEDVMCYEDGGPWFLGGTLVYPCAAMPDGQEVWDCGADDYYGESPTNGSYLDDHWNLVDSGWLSWSA